MRLASDRTAPQCFDDGVLGFLFPGKVEVWIFRSMPLLEYVSYKDQRSFVREVKAIYTTLTEEVALMALAALE